MQDIHRTAPQTRESHFQWAKMRKTAIDDLPHHDNDREEQQCFPEVNNMSDIVHRKA
jgi:hypothetical protein